MAHLRSLVAHGLERENRYKQRYKILEEKKENHNMENNKEPAGNGS